MQMDAIGRDRRDLVTAVIGGPESLGLATNYGDFGQLWQFVFDSRLFALIRG